MSSNDFVPSSDAEFNLWQAALIVLVQASATAWGITAADAAALIAQQALWNTAFGKASNKQNRTAADVKAKNDARKVYEKALRQFIAQWLARNVKVSNSDRERMGLTVKSTTRTSSAQPTTSPVVTVNFSVRLQHSLGFVDETTTTSKAKPQGVMGAEVWAKVGEEVDYKYLGLSTRTPFIARYADAEANKAVSYRLRWINTRGEQGPWSSPVSSIIVG